jgi:hypothetical protein
MPNKRVDHAAHHPIARLHALDGGQRNARPLGKRLLIDASQRPRSPHLS